MSDTPEWLEYLPAMDPEYCTPVTVCLDGEWCEDICTGVIDGVAQLVDQVAAPVDCVRINLDHLGGMGFALQEWVDHGDGDALTAQEWSALVDRWALRETTDDDKLTIARALGSVLP